MYLQLRLRKLLRSGGMRDPDAEHSCFDEVAFQFYLVKYAEVIGLDALLIA